MINGGPAGWRTGRDAFGMWAEEPATGMRFRLLPAGTYMIGLSEGELAAARAIEPEPNISVSELTPVRSVRLDAVLIGETPFTTAVARHVLPDLAVDGADQPAMLSLDDAETVATALGCRLPTEAEWESACRAGSSTLFVWGSTLPGQAELDRWLTWSLGTDPVQRNPFGLAGLFFGEWCADEFRISHSPGAAVRPGARVVKGGGAQFWPWQDQEWVWCMSAMRMPSTGLFEDQRCAARPVRELNTA
ncbi:MAG TPA: SUMF1/EgtB/PvdO family nonheme iron enzyme [Candidatus Limnocylindrales bacterium]|nr:SUMF1/EgtB/PvdO family nonheme iron enzyme [Candidatus Limnocylindrales bacterium]